MKPEPATETPVKTRVETYLRRATRGLWGRKRLEVREELAAHLARAGVLSYQIAGYEGNVTPLEKALAELGKPQEVSLGMVKLYTFPKAVGFRSLHFAAVCIVTVAIAL